MDKNGKLKMKVQVRPGSKSFKSKIMALVDLGSEFTELMAGSVAPGKFPTRIPLSGLHSPYALSLSKVPASEI